MMVGENVHYDTYTECDGCQSKRWAIEAERAINEGLCFEIARLKELANTLIMSIRHSTTCSFMWDGEPCTCGATEARAAYQKVFPNA